MPSADVRPRSRLWAMARMRCPRCLRGPVFRTLLQTHERCPVCGLRYGREEGYFTGAMYVSYTLSLLIMAALFAVLFLVSTRTMFAIEILLLVTAALFVPVVPLVFRYSRVLWLYLDRRFDPDTTG